MEKQKPVVKVSGEHGVSIAVFQHTFPDGGVSYNANIQRSYKRKDAQDWTQESISVFSEDLLNVANVCERAYNKIMDLKAMMKGASQASKEVQAQATTAADNDPDQEIPF